MTVPGPRMLGITREVPLIGKVFPWRNGQPALIVLEGSDLRYLPLFDDEKQMADLAELCENGFEWDSVKEVTGYEFIDSFKGTDVRVIMNIRMVNGKLRFVQLPVREELH